MNEVLIVGAGPAGLAVALQFQRYGIVPRLFERRHPGGLLWNANLVENYPGFKDGVSGPDLVRAFLNQLGQIDIIEQPVVELSWENGSFTARTPNATYRARVAVIASGTKPRTLIGFAIPMGFVDHVLYDIRDILDESGKRIIIVGSGDAAFDFAINLARENSIQILNRNAQVKCLPILWERATKCEKIYYQAETFITKLETGSAGDMIVECSCPRGNLRIQADYLVGAIGRDPQLDFLSESLLEKSAELQQMGLLHYVGDVKNGNMRQVAVAVGDGIRAGMLIQQKIRGYSS